MSEEAIQKYMVAIARDLIKKTTTAATSPVEWEGKPGDDTLKAVYNGGVVTISTSPRWLGVDTAQGREVLYGSEEVSVVDELLTAVMAQRSVRREVKNTQQLTLREEALGAVLGRGIEA